MNRGMLVNEELSDSDGKNQNTYSSNNHLHLY
jgi:hypothetical protein